MCERECEFGLLVKELIYYRNSFHYFSTAKCDQSPVCRSCWMTVAIYHLERH